MQKQRFLSRISNNVPDARIEGTFAFSESLPTSAILPCINFDQSIHTTIQQFEQNSERGVTEWQGKAMIGLGSYKNWTFFAWPLFYFAFSFFICHHQFTTIILVAITFIIFINKGVLCYQRGFRLPLFSIMLNTRSTQSNLKMWKQVIYQQHHRLVLRGGKRILTQLHFRQNVKVL